MVSRQLGSAILYPWTPIYLQDFTKLTCGGSYIIYLEKGEGRKHSSLCSFVFQSQPKGRISNCFPDPSETPTPTVLPFADKTEVASVCLMHETKQDGTKHCHQILISIDFET